MFRRLLNCICVKDYYDIEGKRYYVREMLAQGGFSTVDLVSEAGTDRLYALKKIRCHSSEDEQTALNEVNYHKQIHHPAVIECIGSLAIGSADISHNKTSTVLLLLPFYKLGTLQNVLEKRHRIKDHLNENLIYTFFHQICEGLRAIHNVGAVHRDLKPANVLLSQGDRVVIMDLGSMAPSRVEIKSYQAAQRLQDDAAERCSMTYRAPELFSVESPSTIDERTDIWSLGCLLYALCFFRSPFDEVYERGDSVALACASGNLHIPPDNPYQQGWIDLIKSMLTVDPQQRPFIDEVVSSLESMRGTCNM